MSKIFTNTAKDPIISPNFVVWRFFGKAQFPHSFERIARNYAETVSFHKISTPENQVKLRDFSHCEEQIAFAVSFNTTTVTNISSIDPQLLENFHKEADTLLILYALDVAK